jgi:hypothetical protein
MHDEIDFSVTQSSTSGASSTPCHRQRGDLTTVLLARLSVDAHLTQTDQPESGHSQMSPSGS